ncbi:MAG TPA: DUF3095 family protein, partial [Beijerinckiaceae bacterium]|nr:DUF3095 family protein [Beijerinckiaceae bacterium]
MAGWRQTECALPLAARDRRFRRSSGGCYKSAMAHPSVAVNPRDARDGSDFYDSLPLFTRFTQLTDPSIYTPLPEGWVLGLADIVR